MTVKELRHHYANWSADQHGTPAKHRKLARRMAREADVEFVRQLYTPPPGVHPSGLPPRPTIRELRNVFAEELEGWSGFDLGYEFAAEMTGEELRRWWKKTGKAYFMRLEEE